MLTSSFFLKSAISSYNSTRAIPCIPLTTMFARSVRSTLRSVSRSISSSSRAQQPQRYTRHAVLAASTAVAAAFALTQESRTVHNDDKKVEIKSVLDQPSLKTNLRKEDHSSSSKTSTTSSDPAPEIVVEKKEEAEAEGQSAYNPETGEINWDCPCLGGMADGPCGPQFKEAFSCFVYSEQEPKGIECVEKFKNMQDCFRQHPDIYGEEIADDEDEGDETPMSEDGKIVGKPLPAGHPDLEKVPKAPNAEPPASSPIPDLTHENQMSKGVQKLQPKGQRSDKKGVTQAGDGTA